VAERTGGITSISGRDIRCPDFVRDTSIKKEPEEEEQVDSEKK
jgi:hypothetical protein